MIFLKLKKTFFQLSKDTIVGFVYIPPQGSPFYNTNEGNGIVMLHTVIEIIMLKYDDFNLILTGDFNSRTGNSEDYIVDDDATYLDIDD